MDYFLGIDLGSTTSKAIVIDEDENLMGRGLTNTRSNYKIATQVAEEEAKVNTRFAFFSEELEKQAEIPTGNLNEILEKFELLFRYEQYLYNLNVLKESVDRELISFQAPERADFTSIENEIFKELEDESFEFFIEMGKDKSSFFRDMVGSQYMRLAERENEYFEILMSIYDKCILQVENQVLEMKIGEMAVRALKNLPRLMDINEASREQIKNAFDIASRKILEIKRTVGTGYGRQHLPFPKEQIQSEILCHGLGAHYMFPRTHTVLDIGGQDTKAIQVDQNGIVTGFFMNDRCAAGCGRFLGYIADELNLGLHELGPLSLQSKKRIKISSTCTVFASVELRDRLSIGERREDILAGLHRSIVKRAMSLLARSGGVNNEFTFTGGVAKNQSVVKNVKEMIEENYGDITINVSPDSIYTGSMGAALFARRG
ncbi:MAG: BadF/BadG/BcrA/BcrD ATPase family protein [Thermodesulfobacteriota bacterium]|nr:BadF/BadG/BcrA/BcrD ATPase family protein [Thermodesulfobacteriota bacterium]